jgi:hypothetical protein
MIRRIIPWKATGPGDVTILRAEERRLTKLVTESGVVGYEGASSFEVEARRIDCVEDIAELLDELAPRSDSCVIRGVLKPEFAGRPKVMRRSRDRPGVAARFEEVPRSWAMVDLDSLPCPPGVDLTDPVLVGGALRRHLPRPLQVARCVAQLSSQAGLQSGLRAHLWFVLDRPLARADMKRWLGDVPGVDLQVYVPVQPHYTASPIFEDVDDPCTERLALLPGHAEVAVPDLPDKLIRAVFAPAKQRPYEALRRSSGFKATRAEAYMLACLRAVAEARVGDRHPTIVRVAARLFGMAKSGALDPSDVAGRIKGAVALSTFDRDPDEIDEALRWAWEHAGPWRLPR